MAHVPWDLEVWGVPAFPRGLGEGTPLRDPGAETAGPQPGKQPPQRPQRECEEEKGPEGEEQGPDVEGLARNGAEAGRNRGQGRRGSGGPAAWAGGPVLVPRVGMAREKGSGWGTWPGVAYESQDPRLMGNDGQLLCIHSVYEVKPTTK